MRIGQPAEPRKKKTSANLLHCLRIFSGDFFLSMCVCVGLELVVSLQLCNILL